MGFENHCNSGETSTKIITCFSMNGLHRPSDDFDANTVNRHQVVLIIQIVTSRTFSGFADKPLVSVCLEAGLLHQNFLSPSSVLRQLLAGKVT